MDSKEFGKKPVEEQIKIISKRLDEMRKNKTTVRDFPTDELNFSYPSQKLKKQGYWLDQTEYVLKRYAREGEMVLACLIANGIIVNRYTAKRNEPRGLFCGIGQCTDCAMVVNGKPNVRTCITPVKEGMVIETQKGVGKKVATDD